MKQRSFASWALPLGATALFVVIGFRDAIPAYCEAREMRDQRDRLARESAELREEIVRYRLEKQQLQQSYFYNERLSRLLYQRGPEEKKK